MNLKILPVLYLIPSVIGHTFSDHQKINISKNGSSGAFTSPGYPGNYPSNAHYTWTLTTGNSNAMVVLNITDFSVVRYRFATNCEDYLKIERIKPYYAILMKRCGEMAPFNIYYTGNIFVVTFVSDSIHNARGFHLSWKVYIPDTTITKPTTTTTKITTRTKPKTTTEITTFKTTEEQATTTTETTKITTSRTTTPNPIAKKSTREIHTLTTAMLTSNQKQPKTQKHGPFTKTTESYIVNERGQMLSVNQDINASKNGSSGAFTSPGYPGNYPNNANYTWTLTTGDSNARVVLNITDFSVIRYRFTSKCDDYLQIERTEPNSALILKRCGDFHSFNLEYTGKIFVVTFVSDSIHSSRGFNLSWKVYIPDTTTKRTTTTTTTKLTTTTEITTRKPTTTTTTSEITIKKTVERATTTIETTTSRTTTPNPIANKSTREIHTLSSALLTSNQKQPGTHKNGPFTKTTESYIVNEGAYLISAIVVIEVILTAIGIYFVKQRRINFRNLGHEEVNKIITNPYTSSTLSRDCGLGNYEIIQLNDVSNNHTLHQTGYNECTYIEVIEHEYDYTYGDIPPVSDNSV